MHFYCCSADIWLLLLHLMAFSGAVDQSKLDLPILDFLDRSVQVQNFAGKGGAYLAEQFINLGFGFPSFFFILIFVVAALNLFGYKEIRFLKTFLFSVLWMLWTSIAVCIAVECDFKR